MLWNLYAEVIFGQIKVQAKTHPRSIILKALTKAAYSQFCSSVVLYSRKNSKNLVRKKIICIVPNNFSVTFDAYGRAIFIAKVAYSIVYPYSMFLYNMTG